MKFFLPDGTPWAVVAAFWVLLILVGVLFAGFIYWVKRYIDKNDTHHSKVEGKLQKQSEDFDEFTDKLEDGVKQIDKATVEMMKAQNQFESKIGKELLEIHKVTGEIKNDLTEGRGTVQLIKRDLEQLSETVTAHHKSLSLGAQAMHKQREGLANLKTVVIQLNDDVKLIKGKMIKKEDKE